MLVSVLGKVILCNDEQLKKARFFTSVRLPGKFISFRPVHSKKHSSPISAIPSGKVIDSMLQQYSNVFSPKSFSVAGKTMLLNKAQWLKVRSLIAFKPLPNTIYSKLTHSSKQLQPNFSSELGRVISFRLPLWEKA